MGISTSWQATLAFRRFRKKIYNLSRTYWTHQMGADVISQQIQHADPNLYVVDYLNCCSFDIKMHPQTIQETIDWLPKYMERARLHILILVSASLEAYLKDITFNFIASKGYIQPPKSNKELLKINEVGEALGSPILGKSSIPEPLKFAEKLFDINYGNNRTIWDKSYKLRCAAAHNGGMVLQKTLKEIPDLSIPEFEMIGISWDDLKTAMVAADNIAALTDNKISNYSITLIESEQTLRILNSKNKLPKNRKEIWTILYEDYALQVKRTDKMRLERIFYPLK